MTTTKELNKKQIRYFFRDFVTIFIGCALYVFGWAGFILSQRITTGGLAGISTIFTIITGIDASIPYNSINILLLIIALVFLDKRFFFKTLIGIGILTFLVPIGTHIFADPINPHPLLSSQPAMALVIGSIFCGLGLGIVFSANGSTGGTDVIVALVNKYKNLSLGRVMMMVDGLIVSFSYFANVYFAKNPLPSAQAIDLLVYSVVEVILVSATLDWYINSNKQSVQFFIFSLKYQEINDAITKRLHRGCTILDAHGGFSGQPGKVLLVVARKRQMVPVYRIIQEIDPTAFVSEGSVRGVYGEGFEKMKN